MAAASATAAQQPEGPGPEQPKKKKKAVSRSFITIKKPFQALWARLTKTQVPPKGIKRIHIQGSLNDLQLSKWQWRAMMERFKEEFEGEGEALVRFFFKNGLGGDKHKRTQCIRAIRNYRPTGKRKRVRGGCHSSEDDSPAPKHRKKKKGKQKGPPKPFDIVCTSSSDDKEEEGPQIHAESVVGLCEDLIETSKMMPFDDRIEFLLNMVGKTHLRAVCNALDESDIPVRKPGYGRKRVRDIGSNSDTFDTTRYLRS